MEANKELPQVIRALFSQLAARRAKGAPTKDAAGAGTANADPVQTQGNGAAGATVPPDAGRDPALAEGDPSGANPPEQDKAPARDAGAASEQPDYRAIGRELIRLRDGKQLPEGMTLETLCRDPAFVRLAANPAIGPYPALLLYQARTENARLTRQLQRVREETLSQWSQTMARRDALPKVQKGRSAAPATDYLSMSPDDFAALERRLKTERRNGGRARL